MSRIDLMGCPVDNFTMSQTTDEIERYILQRKTCQHVVVNVSKFVEMQNNPHLRSIIDSCEIINADGMPLVWASRLIGKPLCSRVAGVDLFQELVHICSRKGYRPFFFGAEQHVVETVVEKFKKSYPELKVAGYRNGYFSKTDELDIAETILNSGADMLFVGFSSPMKEKFLSRWIPAMKVPFCMGVGGSFDIVAGKTKRAPVWLQEAGLEWAYRIYQEPKRMWKRYARTNPVFVWMLIKELLKTKT